MLTKDQVSEIRRAMTWGDQRAGKAEAGDDPELTAVVAMYRAAKRLGMTNGSRDDFLDSIAVDDLSAVLAEDRNPTSGSGTT